MQKKVFTGRVFCLSEFSWLNLNLFGGPSEASLAGSDPPTVIEVAPLPGDETGELWAEVQCKEDFDASADH